MEGLFVSTHDPGGDVPTVVLVHGALDRSAAFIRVQRQLGDLRVVRYDRRGYGHSLALGPAPGFATQVDDLRQVIGGRPAVVVGHSMGGVIALALAQEDPDLVRAVVAYESPMPWTSWWPSTSAGAAAMRPAGALAERPAGDDHDAAERFMRRLIGDDHWEALPVRTREQRRAEGPALVADLRSIRDPDHPPYDPALVSSPVIAAHGTGGSPHHQRTAEALAEEVPDAELVVVEGAGHSVHLTHPGALAELTRRALERAAAPTGRDRGRRSAP